MRKNGFVILAFIAIVLVSCSTSSVMVEVLVPADITVPQDIKKLAVINRSLPAKGEKLNNILEGVLTGEGIQVDRDASNRCVSGVADKLLNSPRFTVTVPGNVDYRGTGTAEFPIPLDWSEVEKVCNASNAEALVALETFDSNTSTRYSLREKTKKEGEQTIKYNVSVAHMDVSISAGWRIYYPAKKKVIDQNVFVDHKGWEAEGKTNEDAYGHLPAQRICVSDAGFFAGQQYGFRISPTWVNVSRAYYVKGNDDFKDAKFKVRSNLWKSAAEIWQKYVNDKDPKIAGRATYNMAVACEIEGKLDIALDWARKSYSNYHNSKARSYINTLTQRIADQDKLKEQMGD
jgi:hypothetical protein